MAIDKAEWQYDTAKQSYCEKMNKTPNELTAEDEEIIWDYAGNHIAFFITWLIRHDHMGELHHEDELEEQDLEAVKNQQKTGMDILRKYCDMCFTDEDFSEEVSFFVPHYYDNDYMNDYCRIIGDSKVLKTAFSWDDYLALEPVIDEAFFEFGI
jgi:hypothetical protein